VVIQGSVLSPQPHRPASASMTPPTVLANAVSNAASSEPQTRDALRLGPVSPTRKFGAQPSGVQVPLALSSWHSAAQSSLTGPEREQRPHYPSAWCHNQTT
jgi:hypothetical protein